MCCSAASFALVTLAVQRVQAGFGERERGDRADAARDGYGAFALAGARFKVGRQRVAHARNEQAHGRVCDDRSIDKHKVGIVAEEQIFVKLPVRRVEHGQGAARRVRGRCGGNNDGGQFRVESNRLAVSTLLPPPIPSTISAPVRFTSASRRSISGWLHSPSKRFMCRGRGVPVKLASMFCR